VETRKVADLKPHPENARIYGDRADEEMVADIRKGVLQPLLITWDNRVIAGHRRLDAAARAGLTEMPVIVFESRDELDIKEALVRANKHIRTKTNEMKGREAALLLKVEKERAAQRQKESTARAGNASGAARGGKSNVVESVPPRSDTGKARDKVGEALGVSGKTAERAAAVVMEIDALKEDGKVDEAEQLRLTLNRNGVGAAHKKVKPKNATARAPGTRRKRKRTQAPDRTHLRAQNWAAKARNLLKGHEDELLPRKRWYQTIIEVLNCLSRIPGNLREEYVQKVMDWLKQCTIVIKAAEPTETPAEPDPDTDPEARQSRGKGVALAHEAINCLARIPKNDGLRKRGFQIVTDWIRQNQ
jgi:ParB-like chromosome segregation protein Spo0J